MTTRSILECDKCGKECKFDSIWAKIDRKMDAAGSMDDDHVRVDLCDKCMHTIMKILVQKMDFDEAKIFVALARVKSPANN
jgi:hypothetical protein